MRVRVGILRDDPEEPLTDHLSDCKHAEKTGEFQDLRAMFLKKDSDQRIDDGHEPVHVAFDVVAASIAECSAKNEINEQGLVLSKKILSVLPKKKGHDQDRPIGKDPGKEIKCDGSSKQQA